MAVKGGDERNRNGKCGLAVQSCGGEGGAQDVSLPPTPRFFLCRWGLSGHLERIGRLRKERLSPEDAQARNRLSWSRRAGRDGRNSSDPKADGSVGAGGKRPPAQSHGSGHPRPGPSVRGMLPRPPRPIQRHSGALTTAATLGRPRLIPSAQTLSCRPLLAASGDSRQTWPPGVGRGASAPRPRGRQGWQRLASRPATLEPGAGRGRPRQEAGGGRGEQQPRAGRVRGRRQGGASGLARGAERGLGRGRRRGRRGGGGWKRRPRALSRPRRQQRQPQQQPGRRRRRRLALPPPGPT